MYLEASLCGEKELQLFFLFQDESKFCDFLSFYPKQNFLSNSLIIFCGASEESLGIGIQRQCIFQYIFFGWCFLTMLAQAFDIQLNGFFCHTLGFFQGFSKSDTAWQRRYGDRKAAFLVLS